MPILRRLWLAALLIVPVALFAPREASAHASLVASDPPSGAVLASGPPAVHLAFNEDVAPLVFSVLGPDGAARPLAGASSADRTITVPLPPNLVHGTQILSWRVISSDGHPVHGTLLFSIGSASATAAPGDERVDPAVAVGLWLARIALYAGLVFGIGGAFFARLSAPATLANRRFRRALSASLGLGAIGAAAGIGFQGLDALGLPVSAMASPAVWLEGASTSYGALAALALAFMAVAALSLRTTNARIGRILASIAMLGPGLALAASGHAATAAPQLLMRPMVFLHATAIAYWIGALAPLGLALRSGHGRATLLRFSRIIPFALGALLLSGVVIAWVQLGRLDAFATTAYGNILFAKLVLVAILLAIAAVNRFRLTEGAARGDRVAEHRLLRAVAIEIGLAIAIFALVAGWRFTPPPRAIEIPALSTEIHLHGETAMAEVEIRSGGTAVPMIEITPLDADGVPFRPKELTVSLVPADGSIEPIRRTATPLDSERWQVAVPGLANKDRWQIDVDLLVSDFEIAKLSGMVDLKAPP